MPIVVEDYGGLTDGRRVLEYRLTNRTGLQVRFLSYGGTLISIVAPDRNGDPAEITLGHDTLEQYERSASYFGCLIGRYANRIAGARFVLDGVEHRLTANDGANHLHGGAGGFHRAVWAVEPFELGGAVGAVLTHDSPAGEEGWPGHLRVKATRTLTDDGELVCEFEATTDAPTHLSLTQHPYFQLTGCPGSRVLDHELTVAAAYFTPVGSGGVPTGEVRPVAGTPFDFRVASPIGSRMGWPNEQLACAGGYDHNFVLDPPADGESLRFAARLADPRSGRFVEVRTTEPGLQLYTGNALADVVGRGDACYGRYGGVALETQHFPDSPNRPSFPSTRLDPGGTYRSVTVYRFGS